MDGQQHSSYDLESLPGDVQPDNISIDHLQHLVRILDASNVSEIEVKHAAEGTRLVLRKAVAADGIVQAGTAAVPSLPQEKDVSPVSPESKHQTVVAPLVGIFHPWIKPKGKPLVAVGDRVKVGQLVGAIQSLNIIYEVETTVAGRVMEILVQDGRPVEYGQPLMIVDGAEEG